MIPIKSICVPASPPADVARFLPLIDHPHFQCLRERKQLGVNYLVFPGAVHTRFEHAIGVLALTQRLCRIHPVDPDTAACLCAFALLHDIGHGPFSHQVEPLLPEDHHARGLQCLADMMPAVAAAGVDPERLGAMFAGNDPAAAFVTDRNLGTDKLDYLLRDALHIGFGGAPDIEKVQFYTTMEEDGTPAIEEKFIEDIKRVQKFYSYLHQHGYLNKTALAAQRLLQRAVQEELREGVLQPGDLWCMTDGDLMHRLPHSPVPLARTCAEQLARRDLPRSAVVIKPDRYGFAERKSAKDIAVLEWPRQALRTFSDTVADCDRLLALEDALADFLGMAKGEVLFAAMPYFRKLIPRDVRIYSRGSGGSFWLFEKDRDHYRSLEGDYLRTFAIRIVVADGHRQVAAGAAEDIARFLLGDR